MGNISIDSACSRRLYSQNQYLFREVHAGSYVTMGEASVFTLVLTSSCTWLNIKGCKKLVYSANYCNQALICDQHKFKHSVQQFPGCVHTAKPLRGSPTSESCELNTTDPLPSATVSTLAGDDITNESRQHSYTKYLGSFLHKRKSARSIFLYIDDLL